MSAEWRNEALCEQRHIDIWFPPEDLPKSDVRVYHHVARMVCDICPVRAECALAGADEVYGVWGGQIPVDRKAGRETRRPRKAISEANVMLDVPRYTPGKRVPDIRAVRDNLLAKSQSRTVKKA